LGVGGQKGEALIEGDRMGENAANTCKTNTGRGDEVMDDTDIDLSGDAVVELEQVVVVLVDGAVQAVFDGDNGGFGQPVAEGRKDLLKPLTRNNLHIGTKEAQGGFVAESAGIALKSGTQ
jgi:hypothetical protein